MSAERTSGATSLAIVTVSGAVSGALVGVASWVFLETLTAVTTWRVEHPSTIAALPVIGLVIGVTFHRFGGRASRGTAGVVAEARSRRDGVPARLAPMALVGTLLGHLGGASVGREGTALQMSGSLTDAFTGVARLPTELRQVMLRASLAGGFGAVFGVPLTGVVFAWELTRRTPRPRRRLHLLAAAVPAAFVGDAVVAALGHAHTRRPTFQLDLDGGTTFGLLAGALAFGFAARLFVTALARVRGVVAARVRAVAWRPFAGGLATIGLAALFGAEYLGLSLPLLDTAVADGTAEPWTAALKLLFTVVALGSGFVGGEVTPLFVIGATWGAAIGPWVGVDPGTMASLGFVTVFAAAARTPLAGAVMAAELFGRQALLPAVLVTVLATATAGRHGIYDEATPDQRRSRTRTGSSRGPRI